MMHFIYLLIKSKIHNKNSFRIYNYNLMLLIIHYKAKNSYNKYQVKTVLCKNYLLNQLFFIMLCQRERYCKYHKDCLLLFIFIKDSCCKSIRSNIKHMFHFKINDL